MRQQLNSSDVRVMSDYHDFLKVIRNLVSLQRNSDGSDFDAKQVSLCSKRITDMSMLLIDKYRK